MDVRAYVTGRTRPIDVVDYTVREDATPLVIGDSSGGTATIDIVGKAVRDGAIADRSAALIERQVELRDKGGVDWTAFTGRGSAFGTITSVSEPGSRVNIKAETLLNKLNTTRVAEAFFGAKKTGTRTTYVVNLCVNPSWEVDTANYAAITGTGGVATVTRSNVTYPGYAGTYHGRVTWTTGASTAGGLSYLQAGVSEGDRLYVSNKMMTSRVSGQSIRADIVWRTAANAVISTTSGASVIISNTGYTSVEATGTAPAGTANALLQFTNINDPQTAVSYGLWVNGDILVSDALMIATTDQPYFDGSFPNSSWQGTVNASASTLAITVPVDEGYDATLGNAVKYYCGLVGIANTAITVDPALANIPVAFPRWEGNIWTQIKALCAAYNMELVMRGEQLVFQQPRKRVLSMENRDSVVRSIDTGGNALSIDVTNYNNHWGVDEVAYVADSVYQVTPGKTTYVDVKTEASLGSINQPVATTYSANLAAAGQYGIIDSDGLVVSPAWWLANGGSVAATIDPLKPKVISIAISAANGSAYTAPYRLAWGDELPALILTGTGVFVKEETITIPTGAFNGTNEAAPTVNNIFVGSRDQAWDRGILAAMQAGGPNITISGTIPFDGSSGGQEFGYTVGSRLYFEYAYYRLTSVSITKRGIAFTGVADTLFGDATAAYSVTFDENNASWAGFTFATYNAAQAGGATFNSINALTPVPTFAAINAIYEGLTFNDHATFPLMTERLVTSDFATA